MKNINEFIDIKDNDNEYSTHHEIEIHHEKTNLLGDPKKNLLTKYFDKIDKAEVAKGNDSIYKDTKKSKIHIPKNAIELKTLIDDLATLFGS